MQYVFRIRTKPGHTPEQYADAWVRASEIIQRAPGARGTRLHRRIDKPDELLAIASWDSKAQRDAVPRDPQIDRILREAAEHVNVEVIGEFEDPEWTVVPGVNSPPC